MKTKNHIEYYLIYDENSNLKHHICLFSRFKFLFCSRLYIYEYNLTPGGVSRTTIIHKIKFISKKEHNTIQELFESNDKDNRIMAIEMFKFSV